MIIRLDKYLADSGYGTRSEVRSFLRIGKIRINGSVVKDGALKIDTDKDEVSVDGENIEYSRYEYYMLHKPAGVISASGDKKEKTVVDLIESKKRRDLFPVGRLDRDTEGLLIITNDGDMAHRLLSPKKHIEKCYRAIVSGELPEDAAERFRDGIDIGDEKLTKEAYYRELEISEALEDKYLKERYERLKEISEDAEEEYKKLAIVELRITEGRYHEIKRMFTQLGCKVEYLKRYSMGNVSLDEKLSPGEYRTLTEDELKFLKDSV